MRVRVLLLCGVVLGVLRCGHPTPPVPPEDLAARLERVLSETPLSQRVVTLSTFCDDLSEDQVVEALKLSEELASFRERGVLQGVALRRWCELDAEVAFEHLRSMPESRAKVEAMMLAATRLTEKDPRRAATAAAGLPHRASRCAAIEAVAETWAKSDPRAARYWAGGLPAGFARETALSRVRFTWVHDDPVGAYEDVKDLPPGDMKNSLISNIAAAWARLDADAARQWASQLPQGLERQLALINIAEAWADSDPTSAARFAEELPPGEVRQRACVAVVGRWATQDPRAAGDWAMTIADPETQGMALGELMSFWAMLDPQRAGEWVSALPKSAAAEAAAIHYIDAVCYWAPELGVERAISLSPWLREEKVVMCVHRWIELDPATARSWVERAELSPSTKQRCLGPMAGGGSGIGPLSNSTGAGADHPSP